MNQVSRNLWLWVFILLSILLLYRGFANQDVGIKEISYSEFLSKVDSGQVKKVEVGEEIIKGELKSGYQLGTPLGSTDKFKTLAVKGDDSLVEVLRKAGISFSSSPVEQDSLFTTFLTHWFPFLLFIGVWIFFMRQMQSGGGKALCFGKSRARMLEDGDKKVTFKDVAGIEESKSELEAVVSFLKDPRKYTRLGGRIPRGVLLIGQPGTGKTLLAKAIAGEAGVPFFTISGSDFVEMFVGVGASRVRDLFAKAKKNSPCIVFIDEIDAVGRHRGSGLGGGHDEREQTLNQLLVEMDGFESNEGVILIAATNRPDVLDPALLRPGRFDRQVVVPLPDIKGRIGVLKVHAKNVTLSKNIDLEVLARGTPGFSGADLANLVNEAALRAGFLNSEEVIMEHFEYAKDKILMGTERKSLVLSEEEKKNTAYHEAGHALIAKLVPQADPVHKVTIIPRGMALGLMQQLPVEDKYGHSRESLLDDICVIFGGRAAEEVAFGEVFTGASSDIRAATRLARRMVCEWGMSEELGPIRYGKKEDTMFLGRELTHARDYSEHTAGKIDEIVRSIIDSQLQRARKLLTEYKSTLVRLADALLEKETLTGDEVDEIVGSFV